MFETFDLISFGLGLATGTCGVPVLFRYLPDSALKFFVELGEEAKEELDDE